jgi:ubiquinone/menaquinone biosynthesis C-methylase UbiE
MVKMESPALRQARRETLGGLSGRVIEIGCGNGANFSLYPPTVIELIATEPDPYMLKRARRAARSSPVPVNVVGAPAEQLPAEDGQIDSVVSTLVLCTVGNQRDALMEIKRVLRPGGELRFLEHVRFQGGPGALLQDLVTPAWRWCGAGCHPNRDTTSAIREAGLVLVEQKELRPSPPLPPMCIVRRVIQGVAVKQA